MKIERQSEAYPAVHHIGIVVVRGFAGRGEVVDILAEHEVTEPLHDGQRSCRGTYETLRVSVRVTTREQLEALDTRLRAVEGVKLLL
ncbi:MAG: DUF493 family protein [Lentisphaerae bacterium]|nr:DUF493 family protein [Lentisphaerota bacterium]